MATLGDLYYNGHYRGKIEKDVEKALDYWKRAADLGHANAAMARALVHIDGVVGTRADAEPFLKQAATYGTGAVKDIAMYFIFFYEEFFHARAFKFQTFFISNVDFYTI